MSQRTLDRGIGQVSSSATFVGDAARCLAACCGIDSQVHCVRRHDPVRASPKR